MQMIHNTQLSDKKIIDTANFVDEQYIKSDFYNEIIRRVSVKEILYNTDLHREIKTSADYFAHIGKLIDEDGTITFFANWDKFLMEYFMTGDKANLKLVEGRARQIRNRKNRIVGEKLIASFRNYAPTLYVILKSEKSPVRAVDNLQVGNHTLNAFCCYARVGEDEKKKPSIL